MPLTTVTGRVRATLRLKAGGAAGTHVVATSWASDRPFPRTVGAGVAFELETGDGAVYRVDPFEALIALPVRQSAVRDGVRTEEAWIGPDDEITVEGELERAGRGRLPPALRARRIAAAKDGAALHLLPPRTLQRGESEKIEVAATPLATPPPTPPVTTVTPVATVAVDGEPAPPSPTPNAEEAASADPAVARRPKKKRPDPSGTPTPIQ
jgi:hypothetical protein